MPIQFESAGPISPAASMGGGMAEQFTKDQPQIVHQQAILAQLAEAAARNQLQAAALRQQAAEAQANREQQAALQESQQQYGLVAQARQQAGQMALQAQHGAQQERQQQAVWSQMDQQQLQQLNNAEGYVQRQVAAGRYTQQEADDFLFDVRAQRDPLQERQRRAQEQHTQLQNRMLQSQAAEMDQLEEQRSRFYSNGVQGHLGTIIDRFGDEHEVVMGERGDPRAVNWHATQGLWENQLARRGVRAGAAGGGAAGGGAAGGPADMREAPVNLNAMFREELTTLRKEIADEEVAFQAANGRPSDPASRLSEESIHRRATERVLARMRGLQEIHAAVNPVVPPTDQQMQAVAQQEYAREFNRANAHRSHTMPRQQFLQERQAYVAARQQLQGGVWNATRGGGQPQQPAAPEARTLEESQRAEPPFSAHDVMEGSGTPRRLTTLQRYREQGFAAAEQMIQAGAPNQEARTRLLAAVREARELFAQYGSVNAIRLASPPAYARYQSLLSTIEAFTSPMPGLAPGVPGGPVQRFRFEQGTPPTPEGRTAPGFVPQIPAGFSSPTG